MNAPSEALATPLQYLKGVGPRRAADFAHAGLITIEDLLYRFPMRYEDRSRLQSIASLKPGASSSLTGRILSCGLRSTRRPGFKIFDAVIDDGTASIRVSWLNQPFLRDVFAAGQHVVLFGAVEMRGSGGLQLTNPQYEILDDDDAETVHTGRIVPVYERTGSVTPKMQRRLVYDALQKLPTDLPDLLPDAVRFKLDMPSRYAALLAAHFPPADAPLDQLNAFATPGQQRLIFEEAFLFHTGVAARRRTAAEERKAVVPTVDDRIRESARRVLPFRLTAGQKQSLKEIVDDLQRPQPMNRLLQGDVGAGKTIVALLSALVAMENGLQVAFMAPTEILAEQHYRKFREWFEPLGLTVAWLGGAQSARERKDALAAVASGRAPVAVGTHALIQEKARFDALGLAVVDEQHRFGVAQRLALRAKGAEPHQLMMSATPIPRTLAMSFYADLDVSMIDELPPGRRPVLTKLISDSRRAEVLRRVRDACRGGQQAYWVCPLIEESEQLQLQTALETHAALVAELPELRVGLLHGRLKPGEKAVTMAAFAAGEVQLLVATTVVEVGVDVPNASLMVIEHAERFGLAQLHQLRGRVGRGTEQSVCILLFQSPLGEAARARLRVIFENSDGFAIARQDLEIRGPGEVLGARQSGAPLLRFANLVLDADLLERARDAAERLLDRHPQAAERHLERWLGGRVDFLRA